MVGLGFVSAERALPVLPKYTDMENQRAVMHFSDALMLLHFEMPGLRLPHSINLARPSNLYAFFPSQPLYFLC